MDLASSFDIPNPYGLRASDFDHDMDGYEAALRFLGDLATGTPEPEALTNNGGSPAMMRRWTSNGKFRRVLGKARDAGLHERSVAEEKRLAEEADPEPQSQGHQGFVTLEEGLDRLNARRGSFSRNAPRGSWGQA